MKRTGPRNIDLRKFIVELKKSESKFWKRIAKDLEKPERQRRIVNLSRINRYTKEGETIVVPGKILSLGELNHKLTLSSWNLSKASEKKINESGGKVISLPELFKQNKEGKKVRIIG